MRIIALLLFFPLMFIKGFTSNYNTIYSGSLEEKTIYLTFDDGYPNKNCNLILDILKTENVSATFFIEGGFMKDNTYATKRIAEEQTLANHTYSHKDITKMNDKDFIDDIKKLEDLAFSITGKEITKYFRPPMGFIDKRKEKILNDLGYKVFNWSVTCYDYNRYDDKGVDYVFKSITTNVSNGSIILMHTLTDSNVIALPLIIKDLRSKGYRFGDLKEL